MAAANHRRLELQKDPLQNITAWVLTDGKAGDEGQCLGITDALGLIPEIRRVAPRAPFFWLMPWGAIDPRDTPHRPSSPIAPPFPDLLVASGRRAVPYVRAVKRASKGRTFTVFLKDPRTGPGVADLIWVPDYDAIQGPNVIRTLTSPHRVSAERLAAARRQPRPTPRCPAPPARGGAGRGAQPAPALHRAGHPPLCRPSDGLGTRGRVPDGDGVAAHPARAARRAPAIDGRARRLLLGRQRRKSLRGAARARRRRGGNGRFRQHGGRSRRQRRAGAVVRTAERLR